MLQSNGGSEHRQRPPPAAPALLKDSPGRAAFPAGLQERSAQWRGERARQRRFLGLLFTLSFVGAMRLTNQKAAGAALVGDISVEAAAPNLTSHDVSEERRGQRRSETISSA